MTANSMSPAAARRFLPLLISQFLGAANDNFFKNALVVLAVFKMDGRTGLDPHILATLAAGLLILPYFLFSAPAGQMADKYEKSRLMRHWKAVEIGISALAAWGMLSENLPIMLTALFLLGVQSSFTSPIKYAILPEYLAPDELLAGNSWMEGGTFLAILLGSIGGGLLIMGEDGAIRVSAGMIVLALAGYAAALFMPRAAPGEPALPVGWNIWTGTAQLWALSSEKPSLKKSVLGVSWFWAVGAVYLSQFPGFARSVLGGDEHSVTFLLASFSVGIGLGSLLCGRLLRGQVSASHVPFAALGMAVFGIDLYFACLSLPAPGPALPLAAMLSDAAYWRVFGDLIGVAVCGGVYVVPLYAIMQAQAEDHQRSRIVAANNVVNALFKVAASGVSAGLLGAGLTIPQLFLITGAANLGAIRVMRRV